MAHDSPHPVRKRLLILLASLGATLLLAEVGARLLYGLKGDGWDARAALEEMRRMAGGMDVDFDPEKLEQQDFDPDPAHRYMLHPYFGWEGDRAFVDVQESRAYFATPEHERSFDVLIFGGSVAMYLGLEGGQRLRELLEASPLLQGRPVRLHNHARGGHKQPQHLTAFCWDLLLGMQPDAVINLDGFNDVALSCDNGHNGVFPMQPSLSHWARLATSRSISDVKGFDLLFAARQQLESARARAERFAGLGLHHSALLGTLALSIARRDGVRLQAAYAAFSQHALDAGEGQAIRGLGFEGEPAQAVEVAVDCWARASRQMHDLCAARGVPFVHALQPTLHDDGSKPLTAEELETAAAPPAWIEGVKLGYERLRERGRALAEEDVAFLDLSRVFEAEPQTLYWDACHYSAPGSELVADRIAARLLELLAAR